MRHRAGAGQGSRRLRLASVKLGPGVGAKTVEGISYVAGVNVVVLRREVGKLASRPVLAAPCSLRPASNSQLRTGTDQGNPTV